MPIGGPLYTCMPWCTGLSDVHFCLADLNLFQQQNVSLNEKYIFSNLSFAKMQSSFSVKPHCVPAAVTLVADFSSWVSTFGHCSLCHAAAANHVSYRSETSANTTYTTQCHTISLVMLITWRPPHPCCTINAQLWTRCLTWCECSL